MKITGLSQANCQRFAQMSLKKDVIDEVRIVYVDGEQVREKEIEFALAGHHYRYPTLIPENEIWVEMELRDREDSASIIIHESTERLAMKLLDIDYNTAHEELANKIEGLVRNYEAGKN